MAILIPKQIKNCSLGERLVCEKLANELDNDFVILHSLGLHGHETKIWGEADIVVLSTKGFFALEVKGGVVNCKDGIWQYGDPNKQSYISKEDPWTQAKGTMFAIRKKLLEVNHTMRDLLIGFGVVMPMTTFTTVGAEIEPEVLLDQRDFHSHIGYYIGKLQKHWTSVYETKHKKKSKLPTREDIRLARQILRPDIETTFSLGSWLTGIEQEIVELSHSQIRASHRMAANPRTVVRGKAGTGKTVIAVERALQLSSQGNRVLYLCFNQLLAQHLKYVFMNDARSQNVEIKHVHGLYLELIKKAGMLDLLKKTETRNETEFYGKIFPETFVKAACEIDLPPWDVLIIDEAQDLLTPENIDAFDLMLGRLGINNGKWHIFFDHHQNIYNTDIQEQFEKRLNEARPAFDDLYENCRNTRQVALQTSIVSCIDMAIEGAPNGPECRNFYYRNKKGFLSQLESTITQLKSKNIKPKDIAILSTRRRENSLIADILQIAGINIVDIQKASFDDMVFSTIHAFKGLERPVIFAIDIDDIGSATHSILHYVGLSRARILLYCFISESKRSVYEKQVQKFMSRYINLS